MLCRTLPPSMWFHLALQGQSLLWVVTPGHEYSLAGLQHEVLAAGDPALHEQVLRLLAWQEPDATEDSKFQDT